MADWIDRMNNVQERSAIPLTKRRKLEDPEVSQDGSRPRTHGGSGILAPYLDDERKKGYDWNSPRALPVNQENAGAYDPTSMQNRPMGEGQTPTNGSTPLPLTVKEEPKVSNGLASNGSTSREPVDLTDGMVWSLSDVSADLADGKQEMMTT